MPNAVLSLNSSLPSYVSWQPKEAAGQGRLDGLEPLQHFYIEVKVMIAAQQQQARCMTGIGNRAYKVALV